MYTTYTEPSWHQKGFAGHHQLGEPLTEDALCERKDTSERTESAQPAEAFTPQAAESGPAPSPVLRSETELAPEAEQLAAEASDADSSPRPRAAREKEWLRNAVARRRLEALRELQELRTHVTEVWDDGAEL